MNKAIYLGIDDFACNKLNFILQRENQIYNNNTLFKIGKYVNIINKNYIIIQEIDELYLYNLDLILIFQLNQPGLIRCTVFNDYIIVRYIQNNINIYDFYFEGIKLFSYPELNGFPLNNKKGLLFYDNNETINKASIYKYNFIQNEIVWKYNVKELGKYEDYSGQHEGYFRGKFIDLTKVLVSELSSPQLVGTNVKFVGLDIESGNLLWLKEFPLEFYTRLVNYKDELLVLGEYLWKMDPTTGELLERYFPFFEVVGRYHNFLITDDYIFTYTLKTEIKQLSRKTGVILWSDTLYGDKEAGRRGKTINGNDPIQYADGKLYVLDSEKVLHVLDVANEN